MKFNEKMIQDFRMRADDALAKMTPSQLDQVKQKGSAAENLLNNEDFDTFMNWYRFNLFNDLSAIQGYTEENNAQRVAIAHNLAGIEGFVTYLNRLVKRKNEVVSFQNPTKQ